MSMAEIKLFVDEDAMSHALVQGLRARGVDVTTVLQERRTGLTDPEQLTFATTENRAIYTFNVADFVRLHTAYLAESKSHAGIILADRSRHSVGEQIRRTLHLLASKNADDMRDTIEFLSNW
jgi:predicted nuclease of predicted toxin-antitoxin system